MKTFFRNNIWILLLYLLCVSTAYWFLLNYPIEQIHLYVNSFVGNALADAFFYYITYFGDGRLAFFILLGILIYNVRLGLYATFSFLSATIVSNSLKYFFFDDMVRPSFIFNYYKPGTLTYVEGVDMHLLNSFPSGHATQAFSIMMTLAFAAERQWVKLLYFVLAVCTALSRVYLSQHWLSDIAAGSLIGTGFSLLLYYYFIHKNKFARLNRPLGALRSA